MIENIFAQPEDNDTVTEEQFKEFSDDDIYQHVIADEDTVTITTKDESGERDELLETQQPALTENDTIDVSHPRVGVRSDNWVVLLDLRTGSTHGYTTFVPADVIDIGASRRRIETSYRSPITVRHGQDMSLYSDILTTIDADTLNSFIRDYASSASEINSRHTVKLNTMEFSVQDYYADLFDDSLDPQPGTPPWYACIEDTADDPATLVTTEPTISVSDDTGTILVEPTADETVIRNGDTVPDVFEARQVVVVAEPEEVN